MTRLPLQTAGNGLGLHAFEYAQRRRDDAIDKVPQGLGVQLDVLEM